MKLIIDIPEQMYLNAKSDTLCGADILVRAIKKATPLPKGHGALKDFDKIEWYGCDFEGRGCIEAKGDCSVCNHANCYAKQVRELPTIIEADKAEGENKE